MTLRVLAIALLGAASILPAAIAAPPADAPGHITGIGGVFIKANNPKALAAWYRDMLGLPLQPWGGGALRYDAPGHPPAAAWSAFAASSTYFSPSNSPFMIDYAVDDLDALLARLHEHGIEPIKRADDDQNGRFAWVMDPEGNKVELWQPKKAP